MDNLVTIVKTPHTRTAISFVEEFNNAWMQVYTMYYNSFSADVIIGIVHHLN